MPRGIYKRSEIGRQRMSASAQERYKRSLHPRCGCKQSDEAKEKIRLYNIGRVLSDETRQKLRIASTGRLHSFETKLRLRAMNSGSKHPNYGKSFSNVTKCKMRVIALQRVLSSGTMINQGLNEKSLLDIQEQLDGSTILRQYPITKLGYVVDGYCPETNTVYEVYENAHDKTVQEDLQRETEICNLLSCNFHIIWDRTH